jgi:molybdopterin-guanine dinucleotide biosynthesis protein A
MGRPKAPLPLPDGRALVEHVADTALQMRQWIDEIVILGQCADLPASLGHLRVLPDAEPSAGPLMGLRSLLEYARQRWCLLLACDMPLLTPHLLERLHSAVHSECDAVAFRDTCEAATWHACCALYHPRLLPLANAELNNGRRSLRNLLGTARVVAIDPTPVEERSLLNLNTPPDYDCLWKPD